MVRQIALPAALTELNLDVDDELLLPVTVPSSFSDVYNAKLLWKKAELHSRMFTI
jgi:hypothetical protein